MEKSQQNGAPAVGPSVSATSIGAASPAAQAQVARFLKVLQPYNTTKEWLRTRVESLSAEEAISDQEVRKARNNFVVLTAKVLRRDPKLMKSKYDEVFWKTIMYPLVRALSDKADVLQDSSLRTALREHINCGHAAFHSFLEAILDRFGVYVDSMDQLPNAVESLSGLGLKAEHAAWIVAFWNRCLCSLGDLYRYSFGFNANSMVAASHYYELAALTRPADGRAISCLGIVQKEIGEPFTATYFYLLSACKKGKYAYFMKNLESIQGPVQDLCSAFGAGTDAPSPTQEPVEIVKGFSVNVLNLVHCLLFEDRYADKLNRAFTVTLEFLSVSLRQPVPDAGQWREADYTTAPYLHPDLLWKICLMMIEIFYLKKNEVDVTRGHHFNSLCAFMVTMVGKITSYVEQCMRYWLNHTGFHLVPEPNPEAVLQELLQTQPQKIHQSKGQSGAMSKKNKVEHLRSEAQRPVTSDSDADPDEYDNFYDDLLQPETSIESFWNNYHPSQEADDFDFDHDSSRMSGGQSSYLEAFKGFNETVIHLPLVHLLFQWLRCDDEIWTFATVNFPDIICNIVDITNLLSVPRFVSLYMSQQKLELYPLEDELFLRDTVTLDKWTAELNWAGYFGRSQPPSKLDQILILNHRYTEVAKTLKKRGLVSYDNSYKKWICSLTRRHLGEQKVEHTSSKKLLMAQKLGRAWFAEEAKEKEKEFMSRRSDLPKYLVLDTSCLLRKMDWVQKLFDSKLFKIVIPSYVLDELDKGKRNKVYRDVIRWLEKTTADRDRLEIQKLGDVNKFDTELESDWDYLSRSERSVRVMADCAKFFSEEVKRRTDDDPEYGLYIRVLTDLDLQSVYCARVVEQMERLEMPHEIKLMRIHDFMGWLEEGPSYFRRIQEQDERNRGM